MENRSSQHREPPMFAMLVWTLFYFCMWFWAIAGSLNTVLVGLSFFFDLSNDIGRTPEMMALSPVLATVGIAFVWLRRRGYLKCFPELE